MKSASKVCIVCGRSFSWRKKWAANWDAVKRCSAACKRQGVGPVDQALEQHIVDMLQAARARGQRWVDPEAATAMVADSADSAQRLRERARRAARRLHHAGRVVVKQNGQPVDVSTAKGTMEVHALE